MIKRQLTDHELNLIENRGLNSVKQVLGLSHIDQIGLVRDLKKPELQKTLILYK